MSVIVLRGHVLSVAFGIGGDICFSGSADTTIRVWQIPAEPGEDPFDLYGEWLELLNEMVELIAY